MELLAKKKHIERTKDELKELLKLWLKIVWYRGKVTYSFPEYFENNVATETMKPASGDFS